MILIFEGVSVGAINAAGIALFEKGKEKDAAKFIYKLWSDISIAHVMGNWFFGFPEGMMMQRGYFTNKPFEDFLTPLFNGKTFKRSLTIGIAEGNKGKFISLSEEELQKKIVFYLKSTSAMPGCFPYEVDGEKVYIDGQSLVSIDIASAVRRCKDLYGNDTEIILDVVTTQNS